MGDLIAVRLSQESRDAVKARAEEQGISVSELVRRAVDLYLGTVPDVRLAISKNTKRAFAELVTVLFKEVLAEAIRQADIEAKAASQAAKRERKAKAKVGVEKSRKSLPGGKGATVETDLSAPVKAG